MSLVFKAGKISKANDMLSSSVKRENRLKLCQATRVSTLKDFFLFKEILAIAKKKKEIQNKRKYEGNFKKLKKIEKTLISANVALCNYLCNHKYSV